jgi:hypothetical protein
MLASGDYSFAPPDNLFLLNRGNWNFVNGKSRRIAGTNNCLLIVLSSVVLAIMLYIAGNFLLTAFMVNQSGHGGSAVIVSRRTSSGKSTSYYVTFKFTPTTGDFQGKPVSVEQSVSRDAYNRLADGSEVSISYVPTAPTMALLAGSDADNSIINSTIVFGLAASIILVAAMRQFFRDWWRNARLARDGRLVEGQLTSYRTRRGRRSGFYVDVNYTFQSPQDGQYLAGKGSEARGDLRDTPAPPIGTPVSVLFVDNKLFKVL